MPWPNPPDYNEAIQNPRYCFRDPDLRQGQPAVNALGLPWPRSGNNADVYKITGPDNRTWAVKCFTREVHGLQARYQTISDYLNQQKPPFMVRFQYLEQGIRIQGQWYPIVKMRWIEGSTLNDLVREYVDKPQILKRLCRIWARLAQEMRNARIVHGDLQHGNVLLVPWPEGALLRLRLIDYDGLMVPALAHLPTGELGHPNYQHPARLQGGITNAEADRFAHLVIYTALRSLVRGGRSLWERHENGDNLLFREQDFLHPAASSLFAELLALEEPNIQALAGHLLLASQGPLDQVPLLQELVGERGEVRPLTGDEQQRVQALLRSGQAEHVAPSAVSAVPPDSAPAVPTGETVPRTPGEPQGAVLPPTTRWRTIAHLLPQLPRRLPYAVLTAAGGIALVLLLTLLGGLLNQSTGPALAVSEKLPASSPPTSDAPQPRLEVVDQTALQIGQNLRQVDMERHGYVGPLKLTLEGLPQGVTCPPLVLAPHEDSASLVIQVAEDFAEPGPDIELQLRAGDRLVDRCPFALTVARPTLAGVSHDPETLDFFIGERRSIQVKVEREHYQGPVEVRLEGLPAGITCPPVVIPADQDTAVLQLASSPETRPGGAEVELTARVGRFELWSGKRFVNLLQPKGLRVLPLPALTLPAGGKQTVRITVDRQGYAGPVLVSVENLPPDVIAAPVLLAAGETIADVALTVDPKAGTVEKYVDVVLWVGKYRVARQDWRLAIKAVPDKEAVRENVRIPTVDGVQLWGTWYKSHRGREAPCVLLLPPLGGNRQQEGWVRLAQKLQEKGFAVLSFDFRGQGDSTMVAEPFWQLAINRQQLKVRPSFGTKDSIRLEDYRSSYYPVLANDIAAARTYLDQLNDEGKCNAARLLLVGAQEGATLGALWLFAESYRYAYPFAPPMSPEQMGLVPESSSVAGAVWLNVNLLLGDRAVPVLDWLRVTARDRKVPMALVHGSEDADGAATARRCLTEMNPFPFDQKHIKHMVVPNTKLAGQQLLGKDLSTEELILTYCDSVARDGNRPWALRQVETKAYYWTFPATAVTLAKRKGDRAVGPLPLHALGVR